MKVLGVFIDKKEENGWLGLNKYKIRTNNGRLRSKEMGGALWNVGSSPKIQTEGPDCAKQRANDMSFNGNDM